MLEALNALFENNVLSEEIKADIENAWTARIDENRTQVTQELREEFAQRYEHDREIMVEAIDRMMGDQLKEEIEQFVEDRKTLAEQRALYAVKMRKDADLMKEFVTRQLSNEVKDLHEDQIQMAGKFHKLEQFVVEALAQEIAEFHTDKEDVAQTKVRLVREGRTALNNMKEQFIKRAANLVESTVESTLTKEISQLREDINAARKNEFGRKLFEAFSSEYQTSYLSENAETAKLLKTISKKDQEIKAAKSAVLEARETLSKSNAKVNALMENKQRQEIMSELLAPLAKDHKAIMTELLESVQTSKLRNNFDKYLPTVVAENFTPKKRTIVESTEVTGNKITSINETDTNIIDIRRLAGLKN